MCGINEARLAPCFHSLKLLLQFLMGRTGRVRPFKLQTACNTTLGIQLNPHNLAHFSKSEMQIDEHAQYCGKEAPYGKQCNGIEP